MQERSKIHVGLDVHKDSISVAAAEPGRAPGRLIGKVTHGSSVPRSNCTSCTRLARPGSDCNAP